ncbi:Pre-rRNA-processing protein [Phytophthora fragariae]|uniref:Pre-rRNA-processing protein n=1 Tax=Phytophthora fragariae TaxID=53985 RepID=A0A6A3FQX0_9STRA|nr:Pre-rRNA-processing protein [Phytophthora fragariae]KAE8948049.1 Pre-rRNA-processing protein [Phytophthora fragariae]KAE9138412.1 Pre-rRNA-processing protein [Phytophthora fragariae]KAE9154259.1 Pre-rRNA-processing protein [Phytophthora fragariae]KAE9233636.1 Pre-rRNA-processing protein [Phytophthora fragariae]
MTSHHHRSGPLKQSNKKHKTGRHESKTLLARRSGGKVEGRRASVRSTGSSIGSMSLSGQKASRLQRQKQLRGNKRDEMLLQRRFGLGSSLGPPKIVALVALIDMANLAEVQQSILEGASSVEEPAQDVVGLKNCTVGVFSQHKQKLCVIDCGCNLLVALDAAKVADVVVFVLSVHNGADGGLSEEGVRIVSAVRAQGLPTTVGLIQGLEKHTPKGQADLKKLGNKFFATEFGESAKVAMANVPGQLSRVLITLSPKVIHWREARSYMLATTATFVPGSEAQNDKGEQVGELQINGYLRGKPLSVNQLIHVTDVGTFQLSRITRAAASQTQRVADMSGKPPVAPVPAVQDDDLVLATADPTLQEDLRLEAEYDPFASEQTWPTNEEIAEAEQEAKKQRQADTAANKGASGYQAAWLDGEDEDEEGMKDDEEEEESAAVNQDFCKTGDDEDDDDDDDMFMVDDDYVDQAQKRKDEEENMSFPDELDVPADQPARVRFARYRGMKSLRTSAWDPKESLPSDYARLFQFQDFAMVQRLALARGKDAERAMKEQLRRKSKTQQARSRALSMAMEDVEDSASVASSSLASEALPDEFGEMGYVPSGVFVTLHLKSVPVAKLQARIQAGPLVMGALLKHENRLSVLNFSVQRAVSFAGETVKSKEELSFHCGFRRFSGKPVFSDQSLKSDQHLFQRFLPQSGWSVATVYGPVTFQPASLLLFKPDGQLVASGTLKNVNPDRVVLKRVIITGTPVKVKKRKAVVRYMFHSPEDIRWFRPVELSTKHGLTGHIKESLGTHGDLKAVFSKPIKQHDTVCLHLYKRVYPKFPTQNPLSN